MDINEFSLRISDYINRAIDLGKRVTSGEIALYTDISAIDDLDMVIDKLKGMYGKWDIDDNVAWNASVILGTVLGEMIIGEHYWHWAINSEDIPVVEVDPKNQMSPITKIYKIICDTDGVEGDARGFYETFLMLLDHNGAQEYAEIDEDDEPDDPDEEYAPDVPVMSSETYPWERFYPNHTTDEVVEMMTDEGVQLIQGSGVGSGELAEALFDIEKEENRLKIINDLRKDGYHTTEEDIVEYHSMEGDDPILNEMMGMFTGLFSKEAIVEFYTYGTDIKLYDMLKKTASVLDFTEDEIIEVVNSIYDSDAEGIRELLRRYNPTSMSKDTMIEICEAVPDSVMGEVKKYLKLLSFADRVDIQDEYF